MNKFTKLSKFFLVFLLLLLILSMFIACGQSESKGSINIIEPTDDKDKFESTVTFISDGQTINTITIETGSKITSIPDVKKEGYNLIGWREQNTLSKFDFNSYVNMNIVLEAIWELKSTLYLKDSNKYSGSVNGTVITITLGNNVTSLNLNDSVLLKEKNWSYQLFTDETLMVKSGDVNQLLFSNLHEGVNTFYLAIYEYSNTRLVAKYTINIECEEQIYVTFLGLDYNEIESVKLTKNSLLIKPNTNYPNLDIEFGVIDLETKQVSKIWNFEKDKATQNLTLIAIEKYKEFIPELNFNGGTSSDKVNSIKFGVDYSLPVPVKEGYTFIGWFYNGDIQITDKLGKSINVYSFYDNVLLIAKYTPKNINLNIIATINGVKDSSRILQVLYGEVCTLNTAINNTYTASNKGELYAFCGWFDVNNNFVSNSRAYNIEKVDANKVFYERWITINISSYLTRSGVSQEVDNLGVQVDVSSDSYSKYGNITTGEEVSLTASSIENYSFLNFQLTGQAARENKEITVKFDDKQVEIKTYWTIYKVKVNKYLDGILDTSNILDGYIVGEGNIEIKVEKTIQAEYNFDYSFNYFRINTNGFYFYYYSNIYTFTPFKEMISEEDDSIIIDAYFMTIQNNFTFTTNADDETKVIDASFNLNSRTSNILMMNNYVYYNTSIDLEKVYDGYYLDSYTIETKKINRFTSEEITLPIENYNVNEDSIDLKVYSSEVIDNQVVEFEYKYNIKPNATKSILNITSSIINAGQIHYSVNNSDNLFASKYGEESKIQGLKNGDVIELTVSPFNGYVFIGWYDNKENLVSYEESINLTINENTKRYLICGFLPLYYEIEIHQGVYREREIANYDVTKSKNYSYYEYKEVNGGFVFRETTDNTLLSGKLYYTYGETINTTTMGVQSVKFDVEKDTNHQYILSTTVNNGFKFEGWYDDNGNWLSYELEYSPNLCNFSNHYIARFSELPNSYSENITIIDGSNDDIHNGSYEIYSYKEPKLNSNNNFDEYSFEDKIVVVIKTNKNAYNFDNNYLGYIYYGLYSIPSSSEVTNGENINIISDRFSSYRIDDKSEYNINFVDNHFKIEYTFNVSSFISNPLYAMWERGSYRYENLFLVNEENSAVSTEFHPGQVYYIFYKEKNTLYLIAEPNSNFSFKGWGIEETNGQKVIKSTKLEYEIKDVPTNVKNPYFPMWDYVNAGKNDKSRIVVSPNISIPNSTLYEVTKIIETNTNEEQLENIYLKAYDVSNYLFLGWFSNDLLYVTEKQFIIQYQRIGNEEIYKTIINNIPYDGAYLELSPKWLKINSQILTNADIFIKPVGYTVKENGENIQYVSFTAYSDREMTKEFKYSNYVFDGWYDENDDFISKEYNLVMKLSEITQEKFTCKWSRIQIDIEVTSVVEDNSPTSNYVNYSFKQTKVDVNDAYSVHLVADKVYNFSGWFLINGENEELLSKDYEYDHVVLIKDVLDNKLTYKAKYNHILGRGIDTDRLGRNATTKFYGLTSNNYSTAEIDINDGYLFTGWFLPNTTTNPLSRDIKYNFTSTVQPRLGGLISETARFNDFSLNVYPKKYRSLVKIYAYISSPIDVTNDLSYNIVIEFKSLANYSISIFNPDGEEIPSDSGSIVVSSSNLGNYNIYYTPINTMLYTSGNIAGLTILKTGHVDSYEPLIKSSDEINAQLTVIELLSFHTNNEYTHIGWFDEEENVIKTNTSVFNEESGQYEVDYEIINVNKPMVTTTYFARYGKYRINIDNDDNVSSIIDNNFMVTVHFNSLISEEYDEYEILIIGKTLKFNDKFTHNVIKPVINDKTYQLVFAGWYLDVTFDVPFNFDSPIYTDTILYAKWIDLEADKINNELIDGSKFVFSDGNKEYELKTGNIQNTVYYVAVNDGVLVINSRNKSTQKNAVITIDNNVTYHITQISFANGIEYHLDVSQGDIIPISVIANSNSDYDAVFLKLELRMDDSTSKVEGLVKDLGNVSLSTYTGGEYVFLGWYDENNELISERYELVNTDTGENFYVYNRKVDLTYKDITKLANLNNNINLTPVWKHYSLVLINPNNVGGISSYEFMYDDNSNSPFYLANYWLLKATPSEGYKFDGWFIYDNNSHSLSRDPVSIETNFNYYITSSDVYIVSKWSKTSYVNSFSIQYQFGTDTPGEELYNSPYNRDSYYADETNQIQLYAPTRRTDSYFYIFRGWYLDPSYNEQYKVSYINPVENRNIRLYGKWDSKPIKYVDIYEDDDGTKYIYYGEYPTKLLKDLTNMNMQYNSETKYYYDNNNTNIDRAKYTRVVFDNDFTLDGVVYPAYTNDEQNYYYFEIEKIRWNIIINANGVGTLVCDSVFDISRYNDNTSITYDEKDNPIYPNNWGTSSLRSFFTNYVIEPYFDAYEKARLELLKKNNINGGATGNSTITGESYLVQDNTLDNLFLASFVDIEAYLKYFRNIKVTEYARIKGVKSTFNQIDGKYYITEIITRSPGNTNNKIYKYLLTENYEYDINNFKEIKVTEAIPLTLMLYLDTSNVANR